MIITGLETKKKIPKYNPTIIVGSQKIDNSGFIVERDFFFPIYFSCTINLRTV